VFSIELRVRCGDAHETPLFLSVLLNRSILSLYFVLVPYGIEFYILFLSTSNLTSFVNNHNPVVIFDHSCRGKYAFPARHRSNHCRYHHDHRKHPSITYSYSSTARTPTYATPACTSPSRKFRAGITTSGGIIMSSTAKHPEHMAKACSDCIINAYDHDCMGNANQLCRPNANVFCPFSPPPTPVPRPPPPLPTPLPGGLPRPLLGFDAPLSFGNGGGLRSS
jgi:hypothetical protein